MDTKQFWDAAKEGDIAQVKSLLEKHANSIDVNWRNPDEVRHITSDDEYEY